MSERQQEREANREAYVEWILAQVEPLKSKAIALFGPAEPNWLFTGISFSPDGPHIYYPAGFDENLIEIQLLSSRLDTLDKDRALFQLAHEIVHTLAPGRKRRGAMISEAAATYFSIHGPDFPSPIYRALALENLKKSKNYWDAYQLASRLLIEDSHAFVKLRRVESCFSRMTPEMICSVLPFVSLQRATILCEVREEMR